MGNKFLGAATVSATQIRTRVHRSALPQVLQYRHYDKLRLLVTSYLNDRSEATKFRALSALNSTVMKLQDPGEIKLLVEIYKLLQAETMIPESVKQKSISEEEHDAMTYIETSILSITTLRNRLEKERGNLSPKTLKELRKHSEDPMYELAQFISTISDIAYSTFLTRFTDVADSTCLDTRALSVLLKEIKRRTLKHETPDHLWMRTIRVLMLSRDFDKSFLVHGSDKIIKSLHNFDFTSCLRTIEYTLSCSGFEDRKLFVALLNRLDETIADAPTNCLHRVYQAINMMGIYHFKLIKQLNQRYRLAFNIFSLEANVMVLDCILAIPRHFTKNVIEVQENQFAKECLKDAPLITRLMDMILLSFETLPSTDSMKIRQATRLCWCLEQDEVLHVDTRKDIAYRLAQTTLLWLTTNRSNPLISQRVLEHIAKFSWKNKDLLR